MFDRRSILTPIISAYRTGYSTQHASQNNMNEELRKDLEGGKFVGRIWLN